MIQEHNFGHLFTLGRGGDFLLELLVDAADLSRPFAALLLGAVAILGYKVKLLFTFRPLGVLKGQKLTPRCIHPGES